MYDVVLLPQQGVKGKVVQQLGFKSGPHGSCTYRKISCITREILDQFTRSELGG